MRCFVYCGYRGYIPGESATCWQRMNRPLLSHAATINSVKEFPPALLSMDRRLFCGENVTNLVQLIIDAININVKTAHLYRFHTMYMYV